MFNNGLANFLKIEPLVHDWFELAPVHESKVLLAIDNGVVGEDATKRNMIIHY